MQRRFDRLVELQEAISLARNRELIGRTVEVLVEGEGRKGNLKARTRTNKLVHAVGVLPEGTFAHVQVVGAHPHHLDGELARNRAPRPAVALPA